MKKSIIEKLKEYELAQVVCYVRILGETVPLSKRDILKIFGYKVE